MTGATTQVQSKRKTKVGRVVSDKMDKTIVVSVERLARHRLYKRVIRLTTKFKAHDEDERRPRRRHRPHRGVAAAVGDEALAPRRGRRAGRRARQPGRHRRRGGRDLRGDPRAPPIRAGARRRRPRRPTRAGAAETPADATEAGRGGGGVIQPQSRLKVADNTGARTIQCIRVMGRSQKTHGRRR